MRCSMIIFIDLLIDGHGQITLNDQLILLITNTHGAFSIIYLIVDRNRLAFSTWFRINLPGLSTHNPCGNKNNGNDKGFHYCAPPVALGAEISAQRSNAMRR